MSEFKQTIAIDFDGVLHEYKSPWAGPTVITDGPVDGSQNAVARYLEQFEVVVFSTRCHQPGGVEAMRKWLGEHGFPAALKIWTEPGKPPAIVYIDDRSFRFEGAWPSVERLRNLRPWNRKL